MDTRALEWNVTTAIGWIIMKFDTDIHVPLRMNINKFCDPLTFDLTPSSGQNLSNTLFYDQILAKLIKFPFVSAVLCFWC